MKRFFTIVSLIVVFVLITSSSSTTQVTYPTYTNEYKEELTDFLINSSVEVLSSSENNNAIYSPMGLYFVLSMIASVSQGETLNEITNTLGIELDSIEENTIKLMNYIRKEWKKDYKFNVENVVYYDESESDYYKEETFDLLKTLYDAHYERAKFSNGGVNSKIVKFIEETTDNFLKLNESDFDYLKTQNLAFLNVLYYKGVWKEKFETNDTKDEDFYITSEQSVKVKMMNRKISSAYHEGDQYLSSRLSYQDGNAMVFILPNEGVSVDEILSSTELLMEALNIENYYSAEIRYKIPKFDYTDDINLTDSVKALGINKIFDIHSGENHDFIKLMNNKDDIFKFSGIKQGSRIALDEEGVRVASHTIGFGCGAKSAPPLDEINFYLTRPFAYAIVTNDGIPLFIGKVLNPNT